MTKLKYTTDIPSITVTESGNSLAYDSFDSREITSVFEISSISGQNTNIQFSLQESEDGIRWFLMHDTRRHSSAGFQRIAPCGISSRFFRYSWDIRGSTPSVTFSIKTTLSKHYSNRTSSMLRYSDLFLGANNNVSTTFIANGGNHIMVAILRPNDGLGGATIAIEGSPDGIRFGSVQPNASVSSNSNSIVNFQSHGIVYYRLRVTTATLVGNPSVDIFWTSSEV